MRAIIANACAAEADYALAEMERLNVEALAALVDQHHVQIKTFSSDIIVAARKQASDVLADLARASEQTRKVHDSYIDFRERVAAWSRISLQAVIAARSG
jgi:TRAP-type mannitol/chloroaromatic compound transport system substrate-binding protein